MHQPPTLKGPGNISERDRGRGLGPKYSRLVFDNCEIRLPPQDRVSGTGNKTHIKMHQQDCCCSSVAPTGIFQGLKGLSWVSVLAGCNGLLWMKVRPTSAPSAQRVPAKPQLFWALRPEDVPNLQGKGTKPAGSSGAYAHDPTSWLIHRLGLGIWDSLFWGLFDLSWSDLVSLSGTGRATYASLLLKPINAGDSPLGQWNVSGPKHAFAADMVTHCLLLFLIIAVRVAGDFPPDIIRLYRSQWGDHRVRHISRLWGLWFECWKSQKVKTMVILCHFCRSFSQERQTLQLRDKVKTSRRGRRTRRKGYEI